MEITKREILFSIIIVFVMVIIGIFINFAIEENNTKNNEIYYLATKIEDENQFQYGLKTSIGNSLVYGEISATNPVSMSKIEGEYFYIEKVTEEYNRHTRTETYTDANGHTHTRIVVYYSWDYEDSEVKYSDCFNFMGMTFNNQINGLPVERLNIADFAVNKDNVYGGYLYNNNKYFESVGDTREYYNVVPISFVGTMEVKMENNELKNFSGGQKLNFHNDKSITECIEDIEYSGEFWVIFFRVIWGILIVAVVFGFYYFDNRWLENNN